MILRLSRENTVEEVQNRFNQAYPYLKIDFFKLSEGRLSSEVRHKIPKTALLQAAGLRRDGELRIDDSMTVAEMEKAFKKLFNANVQVSRKSGSIWLETTMTDSWTLRQQDDRGKELSHLSKSVPGEITDRPDADQE